MFVGELLDFKEMPYVEGSMDGKFYAKYKVLQRIYGKYSTDTIEFTAYDHDGLPEFSRYKNAMLFVSKYKKKYYHVKYQYFDVYKTIDNRWASSYKEYDFNHSYNENTTVKPEKINFIEPVKYSTIRKFYNGESDTINYPAPYYKTINDSAIAIYGNYIEELFKLKKEGILTARSLFGNKDNSIMVEDVVLEPFKQPYNDDDLKFVEFWKKLSSNISKNGEFEFKKISFDSLAACSKSYTKDYFFDKCFKNIFNENIIAALNDTLNLNFTWTESDYKSLNKQIKAEIIKVKGIYRFREVEIKSNSMKEKLIIDFIETSNGYKFYGVDYYDKKKCCH